MRPLNGWWIIGLARADEAQLAQVCNPAWIGNHAEKAGTCEGIRLEYSENNEADQPARTKFNSQLPFTGRYILLP